MNMVHKNGGSRARPMSHQGSNGGPLLPITSKDLNTGGVGNGRHLRVYVAGIDLTHSSRPVQLVSCAVAVFVLYIGYGYMQELIFKLDGMRPYGWYLTLWQFFLYSCFGFIESKVHSHEKRKIPMRTYVQLAVYTVATMGLSNASLGYLNYPTQVIFKCCKLIPVLIGGILIQGKKYGIIDFFAACLMSFGLILFTLADSQVSPNFHVKGYVMISGALVADAVIGNVQEKAIKAHGASNNEVVFYSYSLGCVYILVMTILTGEIFEAVPFFNDHPVETYFFGFIFAGLGYLGVNVVLTLVKTFGAFVAVTVTTLRKALTIILSFMLFSKPFTFQYVWSGLIVLAGIYLNVYSKNSTSWNAKALSVLHRLIGCWQQFVIRRRQQMPAETV